MILWQFVILIVLLIVAQWSAEVRDGKRNELLKQMLDRLSDIEERLEPISDLPENIASAMYRAVERREDAARQPF
jgi:hypothetical protein